MLAFDFSFCVCVFLFVCFVLFCGYFLSGDLLFGKSNRNITYAYLLWYRFESHQGKPKERANPGKH